MCFMVYYIFSTPNQIKSFLIPILSACIRIGLRGVDDNKVEMVQSSITTDWSFSAVSTSLEQFRREQIYLRVDTG